MKIYNEIIWQWNDETQKLEEVYSDGYEYSGAVDELQGYGSGGGTTGGSQGGSGAPSGDDTNTSNDTTQSEDEAYK